MINRKSVTHRVFKRTWYFAINFININLATKPRSIVNTERRHLLIQLFCDERVSITSCMQRMPMKVYRIELTKTYYGSKCVRCKYNQMWNKHVFNHNESNNCFVRVRFPVSTQWNNKLKLIFYLILWQLVSDDMAHLSIVSNVIRLTSDETSIVLLTASFHFSSNTMEHSLKVCVYLSE